MAVYACVQQQLYTLARKHEARGSFVRTFVTGFWLIQCQVVSLLLPTIFNFISFFL